MNIKLAFALYKNRKFSKNIMSFLFYFIKLKIGEITGNIYNASDSSSTVLDEKQMEYGEKIMDSSLRNYLSISLSQNIIDVEKKKGFQNIGIGCLFAPVMSGKLIILTQKIAAFYFKTEQKKNYRLLIDFFTVPKINGQIYFEEKPLTSFKISTLSQKKISVECSAKIIQEKISKIIIKIDKCWFPKYLGEEFPNFPLGV